jgi:HK97 family phage prohead protease
MAYALEKAPEIIFKEIDEDFSDVDYEGRIIRGWCSTPYCDRDGEIIFPSAFSKHLDYYRENPILLQFHQHKSLPVGKCLNIEVKPEGLWGEFYIAKTKTGDEILELVKSGCLRGFSAGFVPIDYKVDPDKRSIPSKYLRTMGKKGLKKQFVEVELVEISLLSIPSNRQSLIQYSEKGNSVANLIIKSFDSTPEDLTDVINEWVISNGGGDVLKGLLEDVYPDGMILKTLLYNSGNVVLKQLLGQGSYHHLLTKPTLSYHHLTKPRDPFGKYTGRDQISTPPNSTENRLDTIIQQQKQMVESLQSIDSKDSWAAWAKKWGTRLVGAAAAYGAWKLGANKLIKDAARNHLAHWIKGKKKSLLDLAKEGINYIKRGYEDDDEAKAMIITDSMDILNAFLQKGRRLGMQKDPDYKEIEKKYKEIGSEIVNLVKESRDLGMKGFLENIR